MVEKCLPYIPIKISTGHQTENLKTASSIQIILPAAFLSHRVIKYISLMKTG